MALMRTSNPALSAKTFADVRRDPTAPAMTVEGTVNRTAFLLFLVVLPAAWVWAQVRTALDPAVAGPWIMVGAIGGLVVAFVTIFKKEWSPVTAPIYAALEGLALGGLSALLETKYPGIAMQSVGLTFATLAAMLLAYRSGLIKPTEKFKLGVVAATGAIAPPGPDTPTPPRHGASRPSRGPRPASPRPGSPPAPLGRGSHRTDAGAAPARPRAEPPSPAPPRAPPRPTGSPARRRWVAPAPGRGPPG